MYGYAASSIKSFASLGRFVFSGTGAGKTVRTHSPDRKLFKFKKESSEDSIVRRYPGSFPATDQPR